MLSPDLALQMAMNGLIHFRQTRFAEGQIPRKWAPGKPLRLLFAGYNGARNTGGDVRVEEMIRQIRHLLGDQQAALSVFTINSELTQAYFEGAKQIKLPEVFPYALFKEVAKVDGVIACEGSMFKSKFADALSTMMAGALGLASAEKKLSIGYGAEAGAMSKALKTHVKRWCRDAYVICRNQASQDILEELGIRNDFGTDTAWTFDPGGVEIGKDILKQNGWDGKQPIFAVCPINPFWWPVKARLGKTLAQKLKLLKDDETHYKSIYFHDYGPTKRLQYQRYISSMAQATQHICEAKGLFPVLIAMEQLDTQACQDMSEKMALSSITLSSRDLDMRQMVSVLWNANFMLSSRFHAIVTSMPARVVSAGVTMDERIYNLMVDRGHKDFVLQVDENELTEKLVVMLDKLYEERESLSADIAQNVPLQLKRMSEMGKLFLGELAAVYPDFPQDKTKSSWEHFLPPLSPHIQALLEETT